MTYPELIKACKENNILLDDVIIKKLKIYSSLLREWNEKMNLTSIVEEEEIIEKHFYDCLLLLSDTDFSNKTVVDIGTGAGFPGLIIALSYPSCKVTLVDSTSKKFIFLRKVVEELDINNVSFRAGRAEEMDEFKGSFDIVIARAFAPLNILLEVCTPLAKIHGQIIAMKGRNVDKELSQAKSAISKLNLSLSNQKTHFLNGEKDIHINLIFSKEKATPDKYPRSWGEIKKKPL